MRQEEALDGAVKDDDLYVLVGFECGDDLTQFRNRLGPKIFKGGLSNVTRQYDEVRRTKRICLVSATLLMFASEFRICGFAIHDLFMCGTAAVVFIRLAWMLAWPRCLSL